ncbi:conserved hypothetical protein [Verticillium alfalfae VaMs.102]|uniref:Nephrocystin 3-like N-terminal domain-containing protein n=1 Tax=Verticillium alfalfae (strain VaMs.102 / ATCC MYA-4576 / FGSC 10136) TaxID=526221 RepID=C9SWI4_VERA1|nr:conserved hypothetical protein [Verticillium alfalfae VaMs.102]EEY23149.1 conserved hypothetical protein [Verticillium alfalfae VaMs.102]
MEALAALSLVCNVLQLLEIAIKALKICKELRESGKGQLREHSDAETSVNDLITAMEECTATPPDPSQQIDVQIRRAVQDCNNTSQEVLETLRLCQILRYLPRLQGNTKSNLKTLKRIEDQLQKLLTSSTSHELARSIETFQAVQKGFPRLLEHMYQQEVLASLRQQDATRGSRLNAIVRATSSTLNWVFASSATDRPGTRAKYHATFVSWLREGSGFYHFQGKPGSGKSTLMKSVVYNADTKSCLSSWAGDKPLCLASYFFWKPGSMLQKTIIGLVISLVYDIIESFPPLAEVAFPGYWDPESHHLDWLSKTAIYVPIGHDAIMEGFQKLITHQGPEHPKFCFFIDGLDEYDNTSEDMALGRLATLLQEWVEVSLGNMKICVASREYQDFSDMADKHHRIRIQDFTYREIKQHVTSSLMKNKRFLKLQFVEGKSCRELNDKVADQAEGVFLWATLVLPRIHTALDDDFSIPRILNIETPKKMEVFLDSILDNIKPEQQYKAHLLLAIVLRWKGYLLSGRYTGPRVTRLFSLDIAVLFEGLRISAELPDDLTSSFVLPDDVDAWLDRHTTNIETNVDIMNEIHCENQTHLQLRLPRHEDGSVRAGIQGWKLRDFITHANPTICVLSMPTWTTPKMSGGKGSTRRRKSMRRDRHAEGRRHADDWNARENIVGFNDEDSSCPGITFVAMLLLWVSVFLHELAQEGFQVSF